MGLTRTLRKHMKKMLVVVGVLLMIAFLLPTTIQQLARPKPGKRVIAEIYDGQEVRLGELMAVRRQTDILDRLAGALQGQTAARMLNWRGMMRSSQQEPLMDYMLLVKEADHLGLQVSNEQIDQWLARLKVPPEMINALLRKGRLSLAMIYEAVGNLLRVQQAVTLASEAVKVSEPQLRHLFAITRNRLKVKILPLCAEAFVHNVADPDDRQLAQYFGQHQEDYRYPDKVALEYLSADIDAIAEGIKVSRQTAYNYWRNHRSQYTTTQPAATTSAPATAPATGPAATTASAPVTREMSFEEARPLIEARIKRSRARERASQAIAEARTRSATLWASVQPDESGLKHRPETVSDYKALAEEISRKYNIPIKYHKTGLLDKAEAARLDGIGQSYIIEQGGRLPFSEYAFRVVPLVQPPPAKQRPSEMLILTPWQDSAGMLKADGANGEVRGYYIFRVTEVKPNYLPDSFTPVRERVEQDWKLQQAYGLAEAAAEKLKVVADRMGLAAALESDDEAVKHLKGQLRNVPAVQEDQFPRRFYMWDGRLVAPRVAGVHGDATTFVDAVFHSSSVATWCSSCSACQPRKSNSISSA